MFFPSLQDLCSGLSQPRKPLTRWERFCDAVCQWFFVGIGMAFLIGAVVGWVTIILAVL